jgi:predicted AAA+ superfamily ATPase
MEILLEEFYKQDLHTPQYIERRYFLDEKSYQVNGISQSGKTALIKHILLGYKKSSYLYIDCDDLRIDVMALNETLTRFCNQNDITAVALDNYRAEIALPKVKQLIIASVAHHDYSELKTIRLYPLDFESFLAFEARYDESALNHFFQLGGFPAMHRIPSEDRIRHIQRSLKSALTEIGFDIMLLATNLLTQKISAYMLYERLKTTRKISKDMLYKNFETIVVQGYLHQLEKFNHPRAVKKLYLCDTSIKNALSTQKHFGRLFENMVYLEMLKKEFTLFYDEEIDFYIPEQDRVVLCMPFGNQEALFKKIEKIEGFIITNGITKVEVVLCN